MKIVLPWLTEIAMEPKKIQRLIEQRAIEDWYSACSEKKRRREDNVAFGFLLNEKRRVRKFIAKLSDTERVVVYLRYWENLLSCEISALVGLSENKIESVLEESVKKLRAFYIQELSRVQAMSPVCA